MRRIICLLLGIALLASCKQEKKEKDFQVEMKHFYGGEGYMVNYFLNQKSLKLIYSCDFEDCKDTLVYQIEIDKQKANEFYLFLTSLRIDTLKSSYRTRGNDGRYTTIKISGDSLKSKEISLERFNHPTVEILIDKVDLLIPVNKYRLYSYKYEK